MTAARIHIEMINLARATERRARMEAELARAGIAAAFHPAFDRSAHPRAEMLRHCRPDGPWGLFHDSNMAITISHAQVWERFLASDASHALVMEDDIFIAPELGDWLGDLRWWPADADMVKLERWRARSLKVLLGPEAPPHRGRHLARLLSRHVGAAGYMLTRPAAEALLAAKPYNITIDNLLFNFNASPVARSLRVYQVQPALIEQGNEPEGVALQTATRHRPTGTALLRQKLKRAYYELAYPLPTLAQAATGRAKLHRITFQPQPVTGGPA